MKILAVAISLTALILFGGVVGASDDRSADDMVNCCLRGCT